MKIYKLTHDLTVTLLLWVYFLFGFVLIFSPFYLAACLFPKIRNTAFQTLNYLFFNGLFLILRCLTPGLKWRISPEIKSIRSSVLVCNHLSYLDPLLLISLFPKHKTIVKGTFFKVPIFGWMMKQSGFVPAHARGSLSELMIDRIETMEGFLKSGGNLFVFPEGTRSRDGAVKPLGKGAFKIAARCGAPIHILRIGGTDKLFTPGKFLIHAHTAATVAVERLAVMESSGREDRRPISEIMADVRKLMQK